MMLLELNAFRTAQAQDTQRLQVDSSQNTPTVQVAKEGFGGRILSWLGQWPIFHRIEAVKSHMEAIQIENKETLTAFVGALAQQYGDMTAHSAEPQLDIATGSKPLTKRVIRQVESFAQACQSKEEYFAKLSERFGEKFAKQAFAMQGLMVVNHNHASGGLWTEKLLEESVKTTLQASASECEEATISGSVKGIEKADSLKTLDGSYLRKNYEALASGRGALRSLLTGLDGLAAITGLTGAHEFVQTLRNVHVGGMPFSEWGTTGGKVNRWLQSATPDQLDQAAIHPVPRKIERPEISYPKMLAHNMLPRQSRLSDSRSLHALFALQCHKLDACRVALVKLGYRDSPHAQLLENMSAQLSASRIKEDRPVLPKDTASMKQLNDELIQIIARCMPKMGTAPSATFHEARKLLRQAGTELLNQQEWKTIATTVTYDGRKYGCELTPASQMKLGKRDIFEHPYNDRGVCCASTTEAQHATNLWQSEVTALQEDGSSKLLFKGIRHGVLSPFGLDDPELRKKGAILRAKEVVTAALFSRPDELRDALAGKTVTLRLASCSLLTPLTLFGNEKSMLRDQAAAWKALSGCIQPIALSVRDQDGKLRDVKVRLDVAAFNFGVNELALKLGLGHRESDRMNEQALHTLLGPDLNPSAPLGGWAGQYLIGRPENTECIRTMATQLKEIWAQHAHHQDSGEPYKAAQRVAILAYEIGAVPCWNCKSGKDRTGMLDAEIKREAIAQHEGHLPSRPMAGLTESMKRLFRAVLLDGGNLEVQEKNTGASGSKVLKTLPFGQWLNLSYAKRIGDAGVHQQARGLSSLV